jgi:hypothetical protein
MCACACACPVCALRGGPDPARPAAAHSRPRTLPQAVPCDLSVAAVKKFIWRRSDDCVFVYRVLDPANPAPMPKL